MMGSFVKKYLLLSLAVSTLKFSSAQQQVFEKKLNFESSSVEVDISGDKKDEEEEKARINLKSDRNATRTFIATAYCLRGKTASGVYVRRGIIAADPRVLPLGSLVEVNAGSYSGTYVVADTGRKIKGNKIDIWVSKCPEAIRFGRRFVKLTLIKKRK